MLRLTMMTGCFVVQTASSAVLLSENVSHTAMAFGLVAGALTLLPTGWRFAERFLTGNDWLGKSQSPTAQ